MKAEDKSSAHVVAVGEMELAVVDEMQAEVDRKRSPTGPSAGLSLTARADLLKQMEMEMCADGLDVPRCTALSCSSLQRAYSARRPALNITPSPASTKLNPPESRQNPAKKLSLISCCLIFVLSRPYFSSAFSPRRVAANYIVTRKLYSRMWKR